MSNVSKAIEAITEDIAGKTVLEVACGNAEFSMEAAKTAAKVCCIDVDAGRIPAEISDMPNIEFRQMDAAAMDYADGTFDTVVMYNAMGHLEDALAQVIAQCRRVVKPEGSICVISTWMMDKFVIEQSLLPALVEGKTGAGHTRRNVDNIAIVHIK